MTYNHDLVHNRYDSSNLVEIPPLSFDDYTSQEPEEIDISKLQLPPPNVSCYQEPPAPKGECRYFKCQEETVHKTITQHFNTCSQVVKENTNHFNHVKTVNIHLNRNHWHTQRVLVKDNNYHHYLINNVVRVKDIHHQKVEQVRGTGVNKCDFKQTQSIEPAQCVMDQTKPSDIYIQPDSNCCQEEMISSLATQYLTPAQNVTITSSDQYKSDCPQQPQQSTKIYFPR